MFFSGKDEGDVKDDSRPRKSSDEDAGRKWFLCHFTSGKKIPEYVYVIQEEGKYRGIRRSMPFPHRSLMRRKYSFHGICYDIYEKLGAHPMRVNGRRGVYFAVWAPNALRVSVVGEFQRLGWKNVPDGEAGESRHL